MSGEKERAGGTLRSLLKAVHRDEQGSVSIETVLILAAIALPILIFLYKVVWPRLQQYWIDQENILFEDGAGGVNP